MVRRRHLPSGKTRAIENRREIRPGGDHRDMHEAKQDRGGKAADTQ
jgi:hypothetical protein